MKSRGYGLILTVGLLAGCVAAPVVIEKREGAAPAVAKPVEEKFGELVLKADVGTIDVSWKRKEQRTVKIRTLFEKKGQELKALEQGVSEGEEAER